MKILGRIDETSWRRCIIAKMSKYSGLFSILYDLVSDLSVYIPWMYPSFPTVAFSIYGGALNVSFLPLHLKYISLINSHKKK